MNSIERDIELAELLSRASKSILKAANDINELRGRIEKLEKRRQYYGN